MNRSTQQKALSSDTRMAILRLLSAPEKHFSEQWSADPAAFGVCMSLIADAIGVSQPTISRHLDLLKQAGFITVRRHHKWSYCQRDDAAINEHLAWLKGELFGPAKAD